MMWWFVRMNLVFIQAGCVGAIVYMEVYWVAVWVGLFVLLVALMPGKES